MPSLVRLDKIATIDKDIIAGRLGAADPTWLADARKVFFGVFGFGDPAIMTTLRSVSARRHQVMGHFSA